MCQGVELYTEGTDCINQCSNCDSAFPGMWPLAQYGGYSMFPNNSRIQRNVGWVFLGAAANATDCGVRMTPSVNFNQYCLVKDMLSGDLHANITDRSTYYPICSNFETQLGRRQLVECFKVNPCEVWATLLLNRPS
jgi:hypothetical protein